MNVVLNEFSSRCECKIGYKFAKKTGICEKCYSYLDDCVLVCPVNTVPNEKTDLCEQISYLENDIVSVVWICGFTVVICFFIQFLVFMN